MTSPLVWDDGLALSASEHCMDQGKAGKKSQYGTDGSSILDRIKRFGDNVGANYAQGLSWGVEHPATGGTEKYAFMIMTKILSETDYRENATNGDFARNIWSRKLNKVGIFTCSNYSFGRKTVIDYADTYVLNSKATKKLEKMPLGMNRCPLQKASEKSLASSPLFDGDM